MNPREKIMLAIVLAGCVLFGGFKGKEKYVGKIEALDNDIVRKEAELKSIQWEQEKAIEAVGRWRQIGSQTLATDQNLAEQHLRDELYDLAEEVKLAEVSVKTMQVKNWPRSEIRQLSCSMSAEAELGAIVEFLFKLYRRPYMIQCRSLTLLPITEQSGKRRSSGPAFSGRLKMDVKLETLILPPSKMGGKIIPAVLDKDKRKEVPDRLMLASLDDYKKSIKPDLFEPYKPPPPPPPEKTVRNDQSKPVNTPPPPPPPPPADSKLVVGRVLSSPRGQMVVLEDPRNRNAEDKYVAVGEEMYGGILIYVHPKGAVTEDHGTRRFHPIDVPLEQGRALNAEEHPQIFDELSKLEQRLAGIK